MTRRGFSLIELLVAIGLIIAMLGALFAFTWDVLATRQQIVAWTARQRSATVIIEHVERDLMTCVAGDTSDGAGVRGDNESLSVLARQVPAARAARRGRPGAGSPLADIERTTYAFSGGALSVERGGVERGGADRQREVLAGSIAKVRFRYHDGSSWKDSFDSLRADALPRAVEVAIWFNAWPGDATAQELRDEEAFQDALLERSTFDPRGGFDERAAVNGDDIAREEPRPDRVRVIAIPDAGGSAS
jgi:prepilin-type N-terminal cleavage/methylation domain-containing protein